jgi:predicted phosphodiesterase
MIKTIDMNLKFQVSSDLHIDCNKFPNFTDYIIPSAEILILAGDIGNPMDDMYENFLLMAAKYFKKVYIICGNHEFHTNDKSITIDIILQKIMSIINKAPNILHFLNNNYDVIGNIRIVGTTLWSYNDVIKNKEYIEKTFGDYNNIFYKPNVPINIDYTNVQFVRNVSFLKDQIIASIINDQKLIVISHHSPITNITSETKFKNHIYSQCFASKLEYYLNKKLIHTWIYGHTHYNVDIQNNINTRLVSNQLGNYPITSTYHKKFVINI